MIVRTYASRCAALVTLATLAGITAIGALAQNVPAAPPQTPPLEQTVPPQPLPAAPVAPAVPQYQVEVLIFAHREFDRGEEQFSHETARAAPAGREALRTPPVFDESNFGLLPPDAPIGQPPLAGEALPPGQDALAVDPNEFHFRVLRPEELQLNGQYRIIERNAQAYLPLLHAGWVQPGLPENDARPFDLAMLGAKNPMGTIRLYLSRFLHVKVDLSYQGSTAPPAAPVAGNELAEVPIAPRYFLVADRPTRSGELHYFDHPAFGVLIKVTPVRPEQAAPAIPGTRPAA